MIVPVQSPPGQSIVLWRRLTITYYSIIFIVPFYQKIENRILGKFCGFADISPDGLPGGIKGGMIEKAGQPATIMARHKSLRDVIEYFC